MDHNCLSSIVIGLLFAFLIWPFFDWIATAINFDPLDEWYQWLWAVIFVVSTIILIIVEVT